MKGWRIQTPWFLFEAGILVPATFMLLATGFSGRQASLRNHSQSENHPPEVKILEPQNGSVHSLNTPVRYSVSVSDVEDGESKYDEIPSGNILVEIKFIAETPDPKARGTQSLKDKSDEGLRLMRNSDCFTCHQFRAKLIGPSFQEIASRYSATTDKPVLAEHIIQGSSGIWGNILMPAHPDLTREASENIVSWILRNGSDPALDYQVGKEGAFRLVPPSLTHKGLFVVTAYYTDKGNLVGKDAINILYR